MGCLDDAHLATGRIEVDQLPVRTLSEESRAAFLGGPDIVLLEDLDAEDPLAPALAERLAAEGREFTMDDDKPCPYAILCEE